MNDEHTKGANMAERTFTRDEVNRIVEERLARSRRNGGAELTRIRDMLLDMRDKGILRGETMAELAEGFAAELANKIGEYTDGKETEHHMADNEVMETFHSNNRNGRGGNDDIRKPAALVEGAFATGGSPAMEPDGGDTLDTQNARDPDDRIAGKIRDEIRDFMENHPEIDVRTLLSDRAFMEFYANAASEGGLTFGEAAEGYALLTAMKAGAEVDAVDIAVEDTYADKFSCAGDDFASGEGERLALCDRGRAVHRVFAYERLVCPV